MLAQTGVILAAVIGAETEPRRRRTGWGGTGEPTNETTREEPTNETTREDRAGSAGRKTDDSGAERTRGHSPHVRPPPLRRRPRPSTAMPPTHVKQYTDKARPGRDRIDRWRDRHVRPDGREQDTHGRHSEARDCRRVVYGRGRNPTFSPPRVTVLRLQDARTFWPCSRSWP